ncbi:MAG: hypothetical protein ACOCUR_00310 [Nanoarchaeota archaeon]
MKKDTVLIRTYTKKKDDKLKKFKKNKKYEEHEFLFVFDCETTADEYLNLKFGAYRIYQRGELIHEGLFQDSENLTDKERKTLAQYCIKHELTLHELKDFIHEVFYQYVYKLKALCIGFNLPFDLSRLAFNSPDARKNNKGGFSLQLSTHKQLPSVIVDHRGNNLTFIRFGGSFNYWKKRNRRYFKGHFLDLATLACTLLDKKRISLRKAGELFKAKVLKEEAEGHGKINTKYINYCRKDVEATYELYKSAIEVFKTYDIDLNVCSVYSSAGLGKASLKQMGIKPLNVKQPEFPYILKEHLMNAYFGGRTELRLRKRPTKVTVLDFLSMYPTLTCLMDLWKYFICEKIIEEKADIKEITKFIDNIKLEDLRSQDIWKKFNILVKIKPDEDILPVRKPYKKNSNVPNIGVNYLSSESGLYYALPDVILSKMLTGKTPNILEAITFRPEGIQENLKKTKILGMKIDPTKDNFIQRLIEERQRVKKDRDTHRKDSKEYKFLDSRQRALKILANSATYGIFVEMNRQEHEDLKTELINLFDESELLVDKYEEEGEFFNPLIAVMQIAGARLMLGTAETKTIELGERHVYMDTDSLAIPPKIAKQLQEFFRPLNPYNFKADVLKIEKEDKWFYGISSKRYCLYDYDGKNIKIYQTENERGFMLHGLGHLLNPFNKEEDWHKEVWQDILELHYRQTTEEDLHEKYSKYYALSSLSISTPEVRKRFNNYNKGKPRNQQLKPFNFMIAGIGTQEDVKPIAPKRKNSQEAPYEPFINYKNNEILKGEKYWCDLWHFIQRFMHHPESKFIEQNDGWMQRRHINATNKKKIGKEIHNLEYQFLQIDSATKVATENERKEHILNMSEEEAIQKGVSRSTFYAIKNALRKGKKINWKSKAIVKLLK